MSKTKNKFVGKAISFALAAIMSASYYVPEVKADGENPSGYLTGITDSLGDLTNYYIQPDNNLLEKLNNNTFYNDNYNSQEDALEIYNAAELAALSAAVGEHGITFQGKYVKLMNDIDLKGSGITFENNVDNNSGNFSVTVVATNPKNLWDPIGKPRIGPSAPESRFKGTFDGQWHKVQNMLAIVKSSSAYPYSGLFGYCDTSTIRNVEVSGVSYASATSSSATSGGLAGCTSSSSTITNCYTMVNSYASSTSSRATSGSLIGSSSGTITNCYAMGDSYASSFGNESYSGGLVGEGQANIEVCYAMGSSCAFSSSRETYSGGLVGATFNGTIKNCYAMGNSHAYVDLASEEGVYSGGLVGYHSSSKLMKNCYATGNSFAYSNSGSDSGGLVGWAGTSSSFVNCYATGDVCSYAHRSSASDCYAGGLLARYSSSDVQRCYRYSNATVEAKKGDTTLSVTSFGEAEANLNNFKGNVTTNIPALDGENGFNSDGVWRFVENDYPKLWFTPTCNPPTELIAICGQTLSDVTLTNPAGNTNGTWTWDDSTTSVGDAGEKTFPATFNPANPTMYKAVSDIDVTLTVSLNLGTITNNNYPQFYYKGQAVKTPGDFLTKNAGNSSILNFSWYAGPKAEGTVLDITAPSEVGVYTLKVELPGSTDYTRAECILPVRIAVLQVKVADGSGQLSMQAQQLRVTGWEKADSKDAETFKVITSAGTDSTYTPSEDDYEKYIRVVTEDGTEQEVVSEPVLVKFLKNSISFK